MPADAARQPEQRRVQQLLADAAAWLLEAADGPGEAPIRVRILRAHARQRYDFVAADARRVVGHLSDNEQLLRQLELCKRCLLTEQEADIVLCIRTGTLSSAQVTARVPGNASAVRAVLSALRKRGVLRHGGGGYAVADPLFLEAARQTRFQQEGGESQTSEMR